MALHGNALTAGILTDLAINDFQMCAVFILGKAISQRMQNTNKEVANNGL